jgi:hypothetical protein
MHLQHRLKPRADRLLRLGAILSAIACPALARADAMAPRPSWTLSGFGSAGVAYSDHADADYTSSALKGKGVGHSARWSPNVDSRLGVQLSAKVNPQWSAVLQVISEQRLDDTYAAVVEWANVAYQATPDLALRFGRIALPMFLAADYRKVGYAYTWVRAPVEVYGGIPLSNSDGVDASYRWRQGGFKNVTQAFVGRTVLQLPGLTRIDGRHLAGLSHSIGYGAFSARASVLSAELTVDVAHEFFDRLRQFGQGRSLAEHYAVDHKRATAVSIGAAYDPGNWFAMGEIGRMRTRSFLSDTTAVYASGGYRLGDFTPYLAYARVRADSSTTEAGLDLAGMPGPMAASGAAMNGHLNALLTTIPVQRTLSAGARWDFVTDVALKVQVDCITPLDGSRGTFVRVQPGFRSGRPVRVASVVLDFVF